MPDGLYQDGVVADQLTELLLERVSSAIALFDREMRYIACNHRWINDYKLDRDNLIGRSHLDVSPDVGEKWKILHARALNGEKLSHDLDRFARGDGTIVWVRWSIAPWTGKSGKIEGVLMVSEVLTPHIEMELRARVLSEELSLFVDIADSFALCMLNDEGKITIWNSGTERLCGWLEAEALGRDFSFLFDDADRLLDLPAKQLEIARTQGVFRDRCWRLRKDGSKFFADVTISRVEGDDQLPPGFGHIIRDVTKEDKQSRSLEASTVLLRSILETVPDSFIVIDEEGHILSFSDTAVDLFGYDRAEVLGQNVSMLMPSPDRERHDSYIARYLETGVPHIIGCPRRVLGQRKDSTTFHHLLRVGEAIGGGQRVFAGFLRDLTEQEESEIQLQQLQLELNHFARISEMGTLATAMAHELNQPLMAIGNLVQTSVELLKSADDRKALDTVGNALEQAGQEALRAGAIVKRLRGFVSRGELEQTIEDPLNLITETFKLIEPDAKMRNIKYEVDVAAKTWRVLVDRVQIQQVLLNLMKNANESIERDGKVRISGRSDGTMIRISIQDSGPGVPEEKIARLFEPFTTTRRDGMGLGLSICRTIVEGHNGEIWYEARQNRGATFVFTLPLYKEEEADAP